MKKTISIAMIVVMIFSSFTIISSAKTNNSNRPKITYAQYKRSFSKFKVNWEKPDNKHKNKTIYCQMKVGASRWGNWQSTRTKAIKKSFAGRYPVHAFDNPFGIRLKYGKKGKPSATYLLKK